MAKVAKKSVKRANSAKKAAVVVRYGREYVATTAASGKSSCDNGDAVAQLLRGLDLAEVYKVAAEELGVTQKSLKEKYSHLNPGQQRMCLGNRLRGASKE